MRRRQWNPKTTEYDQWDRTIQNSNRFFDRRAHVAAFITNYKHGKITLRKDAAYVKSDILFDSFNLHMDSDVDLDTLNKNISTDLNTSDKLLSTNNDQLVGILEKCDTSTLKCLENNAKILNVGKSITGKILFSLGLFAIIFHFSICF